MTSEPVWPWKELFESDSVKEEPMEPVTAPVLPSVTMERSGSEVSQPLKDFMVQDFGTGPHSGVPSPPP